MYHPHIITIIIGKLAYILCLHLHYTLSGVKVLMRLRGLKRIK